jgi:hypothetical protein
MKNLKNLYGNEDIIKYAKWIDYDLMEAEGEIMPNHITNRITFTCTDKQFGGLIEKYWGSTDEEEESGNGSSALNFHRIIPMPQQIFRGNLGSEERDVYGDMNWYDWSIKNWGTKWNSYDGGYDEGTHTIFFDTAWSAPHPVIEKLGELTGLSFMHEWADEDMGNNTGYTLCVNGSCSTHYDKDGSDAAYIRAMDLKGYEGLFEKVNGEWVMTDDDW